MSIFSEVAPTKKSRLLWVISGLLTAVMLMLMAALTTTKPNGPPRPATEYDTLCPGHACVGGFVTHQGKVYRVGYNDDPRDSPSNYTMSGSRLRTMYTAGWSLVIIKPGDNPDDNPAWQAAASIHAKQFVVIQRK